MDGFAFVSEIRKTDEEIPLIMITGFGTEEAKDKILKLGATEVIIKPFSQAPLIEALKIHLPEIDEEDI